MTIRFGMATRSHFKYCSVMSYFCMYLEHVVHKTEEKEGRVCDFASRMSHSWTDETCMDGA